MRITGASSQVDPLGTIQQDDFCLYHSPRYTVALCLELGERAFTHSGPLVLLREKMHMCDLRRGDSESINLVVACSASGERETQGYL